MGSNRWVVHDCYCGFSDGVWSSGLRWGAYMYLLRIDEMHLDQSRMRGKLRDVHEFEVDLECQISKARSAFYNTRISRHLLALPFLVSNPSHQCLLRHCR